MADMDSMDKLDFGAGTERVGIALEATCQLTAMITALMENALTNGGVDGYLMQAMGVRMEELNSIVLAAMGDELEDTGSLNYRLHGKAA